VCIKHQQLVYAVEGTVCAVCEYCTFTLWQHAALSLCQVVDCILNVMAHAQKPDFVFRRNGRVHLNRPVGQFIGLPAGELCTSACRVCTARASLCSAVTWRLLVTHSILLFPLHFSFRASPRAITFQTQPTFAYRLVSHI